MIHMNKKTGEVAIIAAAVVVADRVLTPIIAKGLTAAYNGTKRFFSNKVVAAVVVTEKKDTVNA